MVSIPGTSEGRSMPASSLNGLSMATATPGCGGKCSSVGGGTKSGGDSFVIAGGQQKLANGCLLGRVWKLQHRAGKGGQRIREAVVAVDTRDFFDEVDLALQVKPPTGQRDAIATLAPTAQACSPASEGCRSRLRP